MSYPNPADTLAFGSGGQQVPPVESSAAGYFPPAVPNSIFLVKITQVNGPAFPTSTIGVYHGERVTGLDSTKTDLSRYKTDGITLTLENTFEVTLPSYPAYIGEGLLIADSTGKIASSHSVGTAGNCTIYQLGLCVVWCMKIIDTQNITRYIICEPRGGQ